MFTLQAYLGISAFLFAAGVACVLTRRNLIHILMGIELIFNGAALNFAAFAHFTPAQLSSLSNAGQVVSLFVIALAATETVVALALVISVFKNFRTAQVHEVADLQG